MTGALAVMTPVAAVAWGYVIQQNVAQRLHRRSVNALAQLAPPPLSTRPVPGRRLAGIGAFLGSLLTSAAAGKASLPLRLAFGLLVGLLTLPLGGNIVVALVLGAVATTLPRTIDRWRRERWQRRLEEQLPSFVSAVRTAVDTDGSLPIATATVAIETAAPLGVLLRTAVSASRLNLDGQRKSLGEILSQTATDNHIAYLQRFAHTLMQAERGTSAEAVTEALEDVDRELLEDYQLRRKRRLATGQGTTMVQGGVALMGIIYVLDYTAGAGQMLQHSTFGLAMTAIAAVCSAAALGVTAWSSRRLTPGDTAPAATKKGVTKA